MVGCSSPLRHHRRSGISVIPKRAEKREREREKEEGEGEGKGGRETNWTSQERESSVTSLYYDSSTDPLLSSLYYAPI